MVVLGFVVGVLVVQGFVVEVLVVCMKEVVDVTIPVVVSLLLVLYWADLGDNQFGDEHHTEVSDHFLDPGVANEGSFLQAQTMVDHHSWILLI